MTGAEPAGGDRTGGERTSGERTSGERTGGPPSAPGPPGAGSGVPEAGPETLLRDYRARAEQVGRLLRTSADARRRVEEAEEDRTAAYASVEREFARMDGLEQRADAIWRELTTRFGPHATGRLPDPDDDPKPGQDPAELLRDAHRRAREPVDHLLTARYAGMAALGFVAALLVAAVGLEAATLLRGMGRPRLFIAYGPAAVAPWIGHLAARGWISWNTSHEQREYAADTAVAGTYGGAGVWLIGLALLIAHFVT